MATEVRLPHLGESIDSALIVEWHKQVGDVVKRGDELADLETDKATLPLEAPKNGVLLAIVAAEGDTVTIGDLLSVIGTEGETWSAAATDKPEENVSAPAVKSATAPARADAAPKPAYKISPLARRKAKELGVDLASVTPADGVKISGADVEAQARASTAQPGQCRIELSRAKRLTGQRMLQSAREIPQFSLMIDVDIGPLIAGRALMKERGIKLSLTALFVHLTAMTLRSHPLFNARFEEDGITVFDAVHIGVATAAEDGLRVPVIHDADRLSLTQINSALADLTGKARENRLSPADSAGGSFTISNLGMSGITQFTPLVNPPQSAILGVAAPRHIMLPGENGRMKPAQLLALTVACDHRVVDGADAAAFLRDLKAAFESFRIDLIECK